MTMTVDEIEEHAGRLHDRLTEERRKVDRHEYTGERAANLKLIEALEGRIRELLGLCSTLRRAQDREDWIARKAALEALSAVS